MACDGQLPLLVVVSEPDQGALDVEQHGREQGHQALPQGRAKPVEKESENGAFLKKRSVPRNG